MDDGEKMILENLSDDIKTLNNNVLYLCSRSSSTETRLKNIEAIVHDTDDRLTICESRITTMKSWGVAIGSIVVLCVPVILAIM